MCFLLRFIAKLHLIRIHEPEKSLGSGSAIDIMEKTVIELIRKTAKELIIADRIIMQLEYRIRDRLREDESQRTLQKQLGSEAAHLRLLPYMMKYLMCNDLHG